MIKQLNIKMAMHISLSLGYSRKGRKFEHGQKLKWQLKF